MSFKICTIGCGHHARRVHGPSYQKYVEQFPDVTLAACCDLDENRAKSFQEKFVFQRYYTEIDKMLDREEPDAVCLIVPEELISPLAIKIFKKGYPLLLEKPPGLDKKQAEAMIDIASQKQIPHQVGFNRRYMPLIKKFNQLFANQFSDRSVIENITYDLYRVDRKDEDFAATAIHGIDTVKFLAGSKYSKVNFTYQNFPGLGKNVANIYLSCSMANGIKAQINFCPVSGITMERITVNCYNNTFFIKLPVWHAFDFPGELKHIKQNRVNYRISGRQLTDSQELFVTNGFYQENKEFFDNIRRQKIPAGDIKDSLQAVEISDYIRQRKKTYKNQ